MLGLFLISFHCKTSFCESKVLIESLMKVERCLGYAWRAEHEQTVDHVPRASAA